MTSIPASLVSLLQGVCVIMVVAYCLTRTRLFADILDGGAPLVDFRDGVAALALAEAAARSAQTGERVLL